MNKKALINVRENDFKVIKKPGEILGDSSQLNEVKLTRSYLYAKTPVRCLKLEQDALTKFLHRMEDTDEYK